MDLEPLGLPLTTMRWRSAQSLAACLGALVSVAVAQAVDLSIASVELTQGLSPVIGQHPLVARNATLVRVTVGVNGSARPQGNVDAVLRIYSNGVEIPESPVYSTNGPITAPLAPSSANQNDTINFLCLPPEGPAITFLVTVNPFGAVAETTMRNNSVTLPSRAFVCRKMVELAYVPVDYTPGGGLPPASMIEPGVGDAFLRAIYKVGDWNYHRSPLPPPVHVLDINISNVNLLNTLLDIRQVQLPTAGFNRPEFIYGWLPGNPYFGNGQANSTPGAAAFGNTDPVRFQRTLAHEIGHCWGASLDGITNPPIDELLDKSGSKYSLVLYAAKRARQINAYYSQLGEGLLEYVGPLVETHVHEKPLSIAMREINDGLLTIENLEPQN